jgi:hypothetical protein
VFAEQQHGDHHDDTKFDRPESEPIAHPGILAAKDMRRGGTDNFVGVEQQ